MSDRIQFSKTIHQSMDIFMHRSWRAWNHLARSTGLSMPQFGILMQVHHRGNCAIGDISDHFDITNAGASQLVDKLVLGGFIRRTEDPLDRRAKLLNLTDKGREILQQGTTEREHWVEELAGKLTAEERAKVAGALAILNAAAREMEKEGGFVTE